LAVIGELKTLTANSPISKEEKMDYVGLIEYPDLNLWGLIMGVVITIGLLLYNKPGRRVKPPLISRPLQPHITLCREPGSFLHLTTQARSRLFRGLPPELDESLPGAEEAYASKEGYDKAMRFYRLALRASKQTVTPQPKAKAKAKRAKACKVKAA